MQLRMDSRVMKALARTIRLTVVRANLDLEMITEEDARDVLRGELSPGDPGSVVDDSGLLGMDGDAALQKIVDDYYA